MTEKMGFEKKRRIEVDWHNETVEDFGYTFKSKEEHKWAKYLDLLQKSGHVAEWQYEPETFHFKKRHRHEGIYTPDFKVVEIVRKVSVTKYHEVKVSLRPHDVYRFRQMHLDHPNIFLVLVYPHHPTPKRFRQLQLIYNARKYIHEIIYSGPIFYKLGYSKR